ncbi:MAG: F0F1 ATP synthase subunit epsilon [Granulosicoccaceae bacterium]
MATINVEIVSAEREIFSGEADMVVAAAEAGDVGVAAGHAAFISRLRAGEIRVLHNDGEEDSIFVTGGILEVQPTQVTVLADTAERNDDIDEAQAEDARRRAEEMMQGGGDIDLAAAQRDLVQATARLHYIKKLRSKR